jgi:aryl carrier-like protein
MFESYLVKVSESQKQQQERKVKWLTYGLDSIREISFNKEKYQIVG